MVETLIDRAYVYLGNLVEIAWKMKDFCMEEDSVMEQKRAWIYCRIAHNGPNSTDVLAVQRHSLIAYAKEHSLEIVGFSNDIGSGLTMDRPGLLDFLAAAKGRQVDILLTHSLTRLGRDMDKVVRCWNLLHDLGISIHTADCGEVSLKQCSQRAGPEKGITTRAPEKRLKKRNETRISRS